jgi:glycerophosphoryl diester phosphodiesterase
MGRTRVIGHRGAPGHAPDHTIEGYRLAVHLGADVIEPDLVSTKDGVLVARHENELSQTTDAPARFPERRTTKTIDGKAVTGWFTEDLTLAELRTLRARQPMEGRPTQLDGLHPIPTWDEILDLLPELSAAAGRPIGI